MKTHIMMTRHQKYHEYNRLAIIIMTTAVIFSLFLTHSSNISLNALEMLATIQQYEFERYVAPTINGSTKRSVYAVVSIFMTDGIDNDLYLKGMCKLGAAIKKFALIDAVLLIVDDGVVGVKTTDIDRIILSCGWMPCHVRPIQGPRSTSKVAADGKYINRYIAAKMYTKLQIWNMTQYQAVLYIDLDTLIIRQFSTLFTVYLPRMRALNQTVAMGFNTEPNGPDFNAGVILLIPSQVEFSSLVQNINTVPHDSSTTAEQAYLNAYFIIIHRLPFQFNAMVSVKRPWSQEETAILHYTCKPWNAVGCWRDGIADLCLLWWWV